MLHVSVVNHFRSATGEGVAACGACAQEWVKGAVREALVTPCEEAACRMLGGMR